MNRGTALLCIFFSWQILHAQPAGNSLLWEISGNGMAESSYILGTMHVFDMDDFILADEVDSLIEHTQTTVLEMDLTDTMAIYNSVIQLLMPAGETISKYLTDAEYAKLDAYLTELMGTGLASFDNTKPIFVMSIVLMGGGSAGEDNSVDLYILDEADYADKKFGGLETFSQQLAMFDSIPYADQVRFIMDALEDANKGDDTRDALSDYYAKNDLNQLSTLVLADDPLMTAYSDVLLFNRNRNWIPVMEKYMQEGPVFFGVGAGHLVGPKGVLELLTQAGYTLTPILPK
ncbi:MAG: TraB/GumN family protein [Chitinophagales bacterium]